MEKSYTENEIRVLAQAAIGKTFGELKKIGSQFDKETTSNKGCFGHLFETDVYDYKINSNAEPDFKDAGIELKVTPYKKNKDGTLSAKERISLGIIKYKEEYKNTFETSQFLYKNRKIQIIWYLYEPGVNKNDLKVTHEKLFTFPEEDLPIIKKDWETIMEKIKAGKAHELSEADTMYLGACTKGGKGGNPKEQPFSDILAKQRAFSLKQSYMTMLVRKYIGNCDDVERVLKDRTCTFLEYIESVVSQYKGLSKSELKEMFEIKTENAKQVNSMIVSRMFNVKSDLKNTDEFLKANIEPKTVQMEQDGKIKESASFPAFDFREVVSIPYDESEFKDQLETTKFMFFVFKDNGTDYVFEGIKLWNTPVEFIENEGRKVYEMAQSVIRSGEIVNHITPTGRRITNFPKSRDNKVFHVRPHGSNSADTSPLPFREKLTGEMEYTKHSFWINSSYLRVIMEEFK